MNRSMLKLGGALGSGCAALGLALVAAPSSLAGGGCANASADIGDLSRGEARSAIVCLFNKARSAGDLEPNGDLKSAAQKHTNTMRETQCFEHRCPGEAGFKQRVENTGYFNGGGDSQAGEIIAFGPDDASPANYVNNWLDSNEQRGQIKKSAYDDVGVGVSVSDGNTLLTAVFGSK